MQISRLTALLLIPMLSVTGTCRAAEADEMGLRQRAEGSEGAMLYATHCATCHDNGVARAPHPNMLQFLAAADIYRVLNSGVMQQQAAALSDVQRRAVAEYLTSQSVDAGPPALPAACEGPAATFDWHAPESGRHWGLTPQNTRAVSGDAAKLNAADASRLRLKWAFALPGALRARSHPLIAGGALFTGSQSGMVYALDAASGCLRWTFQADIEVRTGFTLAEQTIGDVDRYVLYFGDLLGDVYAVDASSGELLWRTHPEDHHATTITGAPAYHEGLVFVPVSSLEVVSARDPAYPCCTFRGSVVALDAATGSVKWRTYSVPEPATAQGKNAIGTQNYGPSGAPVWNTPAVDAKRGQIYFGTGENYSSPATRTSDSIFAVDIRTGAVNWVYQATRNDAWNTACGEQNGHNCPAEDGPDFDFGAAAILTTSASGKDIVLAGQKSGTVHAVNPDTGKLLWKRRLGRGGLHGGVHFGMAVSGSRVFVPISDAPDQREYPRKPNPGLFALDVDTGKPLWSAPLADECNSRKHCAVGIGGAITATDELVFAGALDGYLRIHDAANGKLLTQIDTTASVQTINGITAHGGSMDGGTAPLPFQGLLYVNSGYNFAGHMPGNVLLVFEPAPTAER